MTDSGSASEGTPARVSPASIQLVTGWVMTIVGALVVAVTVAVGLYLMVSSDTGMQFVGWFFTMLFFGAFPAMMGLGLIVWGGRMVRRARVR